MIVDERPELNGLCPLIQVFDMPRSLAFYCDLLGFEIVQQAPPSGACEWAWLRLNGAELMLNTMHEAADRPATPDSARTAGHRETCLFIGAPDVDAVYAYLRSRGVNVDEPVVRDYGMRQLSLTDLPVAGGMTATRAAAPPRCSADHSEARRE